MYRFGDLEKEGSLFYILGVVVYYCNSFISPLQAKVVTVHSVEMAPALVALEEHFAAQAILGLAIVAGIPNQLFPKVMLDKLLDLGQDRIRSVDQGKTSIQVISHIPSVQTPLLCRAVNDQLFEAVKNSGEIFRGFSTLPMGNPDAIPAELERCVKQLGFVGASIPNHAHGTYYDGEAYLPMFAKTQELEVPIYINSITTVNLQHYAGNYDTVVQALITGPAMGWDTDVVQRRLPSIQSCARARRRKVAIYSRPCRQGIFWHVESVPTQA